MKYLSYLALAVCAVAMCACSTTGQQAVLNNLQGCERHYDGTVSAGMTGGQFAGTVKIDCPTAVTTGITLPAGTPIGGS